MLTFPKKFLCTGWVFNGLKVFRCIAGRCGTPYSVRLNEKKGKGTEDNVNIIYPPDRVYDTRVLLSIRTRIDSRAWFNRRVEVEICFLDS
jgi:hypothetical protein